MEPHSDGDDDQHQHIGDSWVIGEIAKNSCDLAPGLGKIRWFCCHSEPSFRSALSSTFFAWLALSVFAAGRFFELRTNCLTFGGAEEVTRFPGDLFFPVVFFERVVMRRDRFTTMTTPIRRCQYAN